MNFSFSHFPALVEAVAWGMRRDMAKIMAIVCSAVVTVLPPGVFITTMPRRVAAGVSTLSKPEPARPTTFRRPAAAMTSAVTLVPDRTINPSASLSSFRSSSFGSFVLTTTVKPAFSKTSTPCFDRLSLTRIFIVVAPYLKVSLGLSHDDFLSLRNSTAQLHGITQPLDDHFHRRQGRDHIKAVDVTHMRDTEDRALQVILASRGRHAILSPQILVDRLPIHALRSDDRRQRIAGAFLWEKFKPGGLDTFAHQIGRAHV